ncbi:hypothetical protein GMMP15_750005 [Candidatus Magnetomoraceae bacterium gMMP-15]
MKSRDDLSEGETKIEFEVDPAWEQGEKNPPKSPLKKGDF